MVWTAIILCIFVSQFGKIRIASDYYVKTHAHL